MKPVEDARIEKARYEGAASLNEDFLATVLGQQIYNRFGIGAAICDINDFAFDISKRGHALADKPQRAGRLHGKNTMACGQYSLDIDNYAKRVFAVDMTNIKLRIIRFDGAPTDDHSIAKRAQTVKMDKTFGAGDIVRRARLGGDISIETLPQLRHNKGRLAGFGQRAVKG